MSIITIFSASYCKGEEVAGEVARRLGYRQVGEEILDWASQQHGVPREKLLRTMHGNPTVLDKLIDEKERHVAYIKSAIAEHVKDDDVVYYGFAGHLLPRDISHILKVCLVANRDFRASLATQAEGISKKSAIRRLRKDDEERKRWTQYLFNLGPWDKSLYDIKIPMHTTSVEDAVKTICDYVQKPPLPTTPGSQKAMEDFVFAAKINIALAEHGYGDVDVLSDGGDVTILISKYTMRLEHLQQELQEAARTVPGVKNVQARPGPKYKRPSIYPGMEFELPSKVLLVDDEREFVQTLSERLQMRDLPTAVVYNGEEALSYISEEEPEVMILDLRMPGIDGVEVLRRVKKDHPHVEVIILTGHGTERDEALTRELGAFAYLEKPVEIDKLAKTVQAAYEKIRKLKAQD